MRSLPLLALGLALLAAGCTGPEIAATIGAANGAAGDPRDDLALPPGFEIVPADAPPIGAPYEFTTAILPDGTYQHARLDAQTQATIRWWNVDDLTHSVVSDDGMFAGSGPIAPGAEFAFTFQRGGDYAFHCRYHGNMTGVVVVR